MENKTEDNDFLEIDKQHGKNYMVVVAILYLCVIILSVFLVLGIKKQKEIVKDSIKNNTTPVENTNESTGIEETNNSDNILELNEETKEEENVEIATDDDIYNLLR